MARSYIAVSTGQPIDNIAVRIVRSRWWKRTESGGLHVDYEVPTGAGNRTTGRHVQDGVDDNERQTLHGEGLDPDDPADIAAIDLVRRELSLGT